MWCLDSSVGNIYQNPLCIKLWENSGSHQLEPGFELMEWISDWTDFCEVYTEAYCIPCLWYYWQVVGPVTGEISFFFSMSQDGIENSIRVIQALATIILWSTNAPLQYFHVLILLSKKSHCDIGVVTYADLTSWKHALTYLHINVLSLIWTLLLCFPVTGTDPDGDSCVWRVLFRRALLTQTIG